MNLFVKQVMQFQINIFKLESLSLNGAQKKVYCLFQRIISTTGRRH